MKKIEQPIYVTKPLLPPLDEYQEKIKALWANKVITNNGFNHQELEKKLETHLEVNNLSLFVNGTLALELAVKALDLEGEIITTPFTFAATSHVLVSNGLTPVFCDIELDTFNINPARIKNLITEETSAIMPVHIFGNPADVKKIKNIADKYNLKVIYDAAQAFGVEIEGESIANFGDISMFSLHATKVFNSIEGGLLTYKDDKLKEKLAQLRNFGFDENKEPQLVGTNAKMNEFQAVMGLLNLQYYQTEIKERKKVAYRYREKLNELEGIRYLKDIEGVKHNYAYFPILIKDSFPKSRNELLSKLKSYNVFAEKYYHLLCNNYKCYADKKIKSSELINAKYAAERILALPIYGELTDNQVDYICDCIYEICS